MDKFTLRVEDTRRAILAAHENGLLGYQVGATLCQYDYGRRKEGAGCAIGVALPAYLRKRVPSTKKVDTYDMRSYVEFEGDMEKEWHVRAQSLHDECIWFGKRGEDQQETINRFLAHVKSEPNRRES